MPCDTIQLSNVEFLAKSTDVKLLMAALEKLGFTVRETSTHLIFNRGGVSGTYEKATGKLESRGRYETVDGNEVKRAYSEQVVESQAKRFGWRIQWDVNAQGNREAKVMKRG